MKKRLFALTLTAALCLALAVPAMAAETTVTEVLPCKYNSIGTFHEGLAVVSLDGKYGFIDKTGREVIPLEYDMAHWFDQGLAAVRRGDDETGRWGFIDRTGREVIPCEYEDFENVREGTILVWVKDAAGSWKAGLFNADGRKVIPSKYDNIDVEFDQDLVLVETADAGGNSQYGLFDREGREVVPCKYDYIWSFFGGPAMVSQDDKYGFINKEGKEIVPCKYDRANGFSEGFAVVQNAAGNWGVVNAEGQEVVPCKYGSVSSFSEGLAGVSVYGPDGKSKWGYIDTSGKEVIPCQYDTAYEFNQGLARVGISTGGYDAMKYGLIDKTGREVVPCEYNSVDALFWDLARVSRQNAGGAVKYGFIDAAGREVIPCKYDAVEYFSDGLLRVELEGKWGLVDRTDREVVPCVYDEVDDRTDSLVGVVVIDADGNRKHGFFDTTGQVVVPCQYDSVSNFTEGIAHVSVQVGDRAWERGCVDRTGRVVVPCGKYASIRVFSEGLAAVQNADGKYGYIDKTGNQVIPGKYDSAYEFDQGLAKVELNGLWGFVDRTGKEVVPCQYTDIIDFDRGLIMASRGEYGIGMEGIVDKTGREVVPCKYDDVGYVSRTRNLVAVGEGEDEELLRGEGKWGLISVRVPVEPADVLPRESGVAHRNTQTVTVDRKAVTLDAYALADANGGLTNYVKLRDLAAILDGTYAQFNVDWDGQIRIWTGAPYLTPNGQEGKTPYSGDRAYVKGEPTTLVDGLPVELRSFVLTDDDGGDSTYYQLRDLAQVLGFNVSWSQEKGVVIETNQLYDPAE